MTSNPRIDISRADIDQLNFFSERQKKIFSGLLDLSVDGQIFLRPSQAANILKIEPSQLSGFVRKFAKLDLIKKGNPPKNEPFLTFQLEKLKQLVEREKLINEKVQRLQQENEAQNAKI